MPITFAVPLVLPGVRGLAHRILENGMVLIEVEESPLKTTRCHHRGRETDRFHGFDRPIRLRHLPVFGRDVVIEIRPKRYPCPHCEGGPTTTQRSAQRRTVPRSGDAHCRVAVLAPSGMAVAQSRSAGKIVELFEQTPALASADVPRTLLMAIFRSQPGSGDRPNPTPALGRAGQGVRPALF